MFGRLVPQLRRPFVGIFIIRTRRRLRLVSQLIRQRHVRVRQTFQQQRSHRSRRRFRYFIGQRDEA